MISIHRKAENMVFLLLNQRNAGRVTAVECYFDFGVSRPTDFVKAVSVSITVKAAGGVKSSQGVGVSAMVGGVAEVGVSVGTGDLDGVAELAP